MSVSLHSQVSSASTSTRPRKGRGKVSQSDLDAKAAKFIDERLPAFFGVKAAHHQASVIRGRNPKSLPKDSELWHYASVSGQRKNLIEHGRDMWAVIGELSLENSTSEGIQREDDHAQRRSAQGRRARNDNRSKSPNSKPSTSYSAGTASSSHKKQPIMKKENEKDNTADDNSISSTTIKPSTTNNQSHQVVHLNDQVQRVLDHGTPLDIKVDFVTPSPVAYGMTALLVNCADEVLYVDNQGGILELRLKPMAEVKPADRIKFKLLDLTNPTNPKLIKFGDPLWLVSLEPDENDLLDSSQPPPVKQDTASLLSAGHVIAGKLFAPPHLPSVQMTAGIHLESRLKEQAKHHPQSSNSSSSLSFDAGTNFNTLANTTTRRSSVVGAGSAAIAKRRTSMLTAFTSLSALSSTRTMLSDSGAEIAAGDGQPAAAAAAVATNHNEASICGFADVIRIAEQRASDSSSALSMESMNSNANGGAAPLKSSMRYNSRQTMHLGKWMASDAFRPDQHEQRRQLLLRQKDHSNPAHHQQTAAALDNNAAVNSKLLMSLTPIIIQQDEYCLSTAQASEVKKWPPTSFDIVAQQNMNTRYLRHLEDMQMAHTLPPRLQSLLAKETLLSNKDKTNSVSNSTVGSGSSSNNKNNVKSSKNTNSNSSLSSSNDSHGKGCLRKIVSRSAPYDFGVDRRCVWKLCLFEEFSDNYVDLSSKEKHAKKVMEMASLGLKMSKKNREGGMIHIPSNTEQNLPELRGGEHFARTLREITFKTAQRAEESFLRDRRIREYKLPEYFEERIPEVLLKEEKSHNRPSTGLSISSNSFRSLYSRELPTPKNEAWDDVGFSTDIIDRLSRKELVVNIWRNDSQAEGENDKVETETENDNTSSRFHGFNRRNTKTTTDYDTGSEKDEKEDYNNAGNTSFHSNNSSVGSPSPKFFGKSFNNNKNSKSIKQQQKQSSMTRTQSTLQAPPVKNMQRLNTIAELPIFNQPRRIIPARTPKLSEDIKRVFNSQLHCRIPTKEMLLLNTPDTLRGFKDLSTGEQVVALHRTMNYFNEVAEHTTVQKTTTPAAGVSRRKEHKIGASVRAKIERLQQEDKLIVSALSYKDHVDKTFPTTSSEDGGSTPIISRNI